jgi:hypothetical protein
MEQIHATMASNLAQIHSGELSTAEYHALAAAIQQQVTVILAQCRLKPEADANLHIIITDLLSGADTMQGKDGAAPVFGAHQVVESMHAYGEYFDHPGWRSLP